MTLPFPIANTGAHGEAPLVMTAEERSVLAFERIADELTLLNQSFEQFLDRTSAARLRKCRAGHECDGEGGAVASGDMAPANHVEAEVESERSLEDGFSVGGHRYLNIQHAIQQAHSTRDAKTPGKRVD